MKSGQILIIVLLVVVVALAVGLSVASRNITNLRTSTQTEQSQRAFTAAEGGIEDVLSRLSAIASDNPLVRDSAGHNETVDVGELQATVNIRGVAVYENTIDLGAVAQVDLEGATGSVLNINWVKDVEGTGIEEACPASIETTLVSSVSGSFDQERKAIAGGCDDSSGNNEVGFSASNVGCSPSEGYVKCTTVSFSEGEAQILRIKPFWNSTTIRVTSDDELPVQIYTVQSVVTTDIGVTRRVEVTRTKLPQLPAAFDYVLYSEEDIIK